MSQKPLTVVELYSGIGGIHLALESTNLSFEIKGAFEINTTANLVYAHNFPTVPLMQRNILSLSNIELDLLDADLWTMSPPCQPFTRQGKQKDLDDNRTDSFIHLLNVLPLMQKPPRYLFLENVKGFETSDAHNQLISVLKKLNYSIRDFLLTPKQFGMPNSRLRYYLLAKCRNEVDDLVLNDSSICDQVQSTSPFPTFVMKSVQEFLDNDQKDENEFKEYLLKNEILAKHAEVLDIVTSKSFNSCCFTKGYAHYVQGTGSVLQADESKNLDLIYQTARSTENLENRVEILKQLRLRWFTPREICNLMGFPSSFGKNLFSTLIQNRNDKLLQLEFPQSITVKQQYRVLGNSVNVFVVSKLLKLLLLNETD